MNYSHIAIAVIAGVFIGATAIFAFALWSTNAAQKAEEQAQAERTYSRQCAEFFDVAGSITYDQIKDRHGALVADMLANCDQISR